MPLIHKQHKFYSMQTSIFEDKNIRYAYSSIHDFFDSYHLRSALKETERVIKAAADDKAWKKDYPYRLIFFMEKLQELCSAAFIIHNNFATRAACITAVLTETGDPDLANEQDFVGKNHFSNVWNNMPRHLNAAQYLDPYKAIEKFVAFMTEAEWKKAIKVLWEYALSNSSIDDEYPCYKILTVRLHLLRLVEACHLLEVRSNKNK